MIMKDTIRKSLLRNFGYEEEAIVDEMYKDIDYIVGIVTDNIYDVGFEDGDNNGYMVGYDAGYADAMRELNIKNIK